MMFEKNLYFTKHAKIKMREYQLSKNKVRAVLLRPKRVERGIAPNTVAVMQPVVIHPGLLLRKNKKRYSEIWVMYQDVDASRYERKIITAWRYPGESPIGEEIPIPEDIKKELLINS